MRTIFILLTACLPMSSIAQCNEYVKEKDPITDEVTVSYNAGTIGPIGHRLKFRFAIHRTEVTMLIEVSSTSVFSLRSGDKVVFRGDGEPVFFDQRVGGTARPSTYMVGHTSFTYWTEVAALRVTKAEIERLMVDRPKVVRIETSQGNIDCMWQEKHTDQFMEALTCIHRVMP